MDAISSILQEDGFCSFISVAERHSIADLFTQNRRCGIYILRFEDEMYYVGQAVDVVRRFTQHRKCHEDINAIAFKFVSKPHLNQEENYFIGKLEQLCRLRNISLASLPHILDSELDDLFPPEQQMIWLQLDNPVINIFSRVEDSALRDRTALRYKKLLEKDSFKHAILPVLQEYIKTCIPEPYLTELTFWGCSCLPSYSNKLNHTPALIAQRWQIRYSLAYSCSQPSPSSSVNGRSSTLFLERFLLTASRNGRIVR